MGRIYGLSRKLHKKTGWRTDAVFLMLNTLFWGGLFFCLTLAAAALGALIWHQTTEALGLWLFCVTGYAGFIPGFLGGALYLGRRE